MVSSAALTVDDYLRALPVDRRAVIAAVRTMVRRHLAQDIAETMNWGMICWEVPLSRYPDTYNGQPLMVAALAAQKNHCGLYLTCVSSDPARVRALATAFAAAGKKFDAGKRCIRFQRADDLPMTALGTVLASVDVGQVISGYEAGRAASGRSVRTKPAPKKAMAKTAAVKKVVANQAPLGKPAGKKGPAKASNNTVAKKIAAKKAPAKKAPATPATAAKAAAKKSAQPKLPSAKTARA
jgi:uncharacterized protein YdhG (YjbR/CyaY superfamily)